MGLMTTPASPIPTTPVTPLGTTPPSSDGKECNDLLGMNN